MLTVLLVGPLPPPMGGDTRHFATLVADLAASDRFEVRVVNISRGRNHSAWRRNLLVSLRALASIARHARAVDVVSFQASDRGMVMFGPLVFLLCRLAHTPVVFRVFGGSFAQTYRQRSRLAQWLIRRTVLKGDALLLQTQQAVREMRPLAAAQVIWFSTYVRIPVRPAASASVTEPAPNDCRRFVFLGHLWRTKGIELLLEVAPRLPADCRIDVYGPTDEYTGEDIDRRGAGRVVYRGVLSHQEVSERLWEYDCLVLPTFHPGEGYPGVIAEAYAHGLPVITTRWMAIPEIVDADSGILVEPHSAAALLQGIECLYGNRERWLRLKDGARHKARLFDHAFWAARFESICTELVER
jgi:glycosyltransferase involved in cell wall biosynthesis